MNHKKTDYDPKYISGQEIRQKGRAVRPKDAATLIIVREDDERPRVLMGRRAQGHKFMPNKFVFPGGRVDAGDSRIIPDKDLHPDVMARLSEGCSPAKARALALAAIRETFEEAGLLIGEKSDAPITTRSAHWRPFMEHGVRPALDNLHFIARAITPPYRSRRFDARFFMTSAEAIQGDLHDTTKASGELLELHWFTLPEAMELELPNITRMVLGEAKRRLGQTSPFNEPGPFVRFRHGKPLRGLV
ncbi:MAG: NUDIX hydrolase [Alphaproteobacteria bacterium]|nr:MAG: NUDIX hydrolase [Alphaproteobacteria bacterium]